MNMKYVGLIMLLLAPAARAASLEQEFREPQVAARPYVWWHWLGPNFSKEGITKDLEAMKASGIGGATIFNISSSVMESHAPTENNPWPDQTYRSPKYWEALKHAAAEAQRLGLEVGLHNTVGYSTTGGPWIDEQRSMQRLTWSESRVQGGAAVTLDLPAPPLGADEGWGKTGRKLSWFKDVAVLAVPAGKKQIALAEVLDITGHMAHNGKLTWSAPAGEWIVYRLCHASTGRPPHPVPDDVLGKVLEADKMSLEQTKFHWQTVIDPLKEQLGTLLGTSFKHFLIDSYEAGNQNWTPDFREQFKRIKGYDPLPWLVTMGGTVHNGHGKTERVVNDPNQTARFEWDYKDVIKTLFFENGWKPAVELMHAAGATLQHEPYGGPFDTIAGAGLADLPMVEFWTGRDVSVNQGVVGGGRAMGRRVIGAEAFTGGPGQSKWTETPGPLKRSADGAFVGGVNRLILHHWVHQPFADRYQPGFGMGWWGTHFNRHQTWFEPGKDFFRYLGRCQALLQRGETPVAHVSVEGAAEGGDALSLNTFLNNVAVQAGEVVVAGGRRYRILHVPHNGALLPETLARLEKLLLDGATVVASAPNRSPSLAGYPACDDQVKAVAARVWGDGKESVRKVGKGTLFTKGDLKEARKALGIAPAFELTGGKVGNVRIIHRADGDAQWFFVANIQSKAAAFTASFAVTGCEPELWDAELGTMAAATSWRIREGRCEVDLALGAEKSTFVVFRTPTTKTAAIPPAPAPLMREEQLVAGAWQVDFRPVMDKPFSRPLDKLEALSVQNQPELKYFSGTAVYRKTITVPAEMLAKGGKVFLDLGDVRNLATVSVNGQAQGVWWHPPFARDVAAALKAGENTLEIAVANTWHNRLVGDEQETADFEWGADRGGNGHMMKGYPDWFVKNQPRPSQGRKGFVVWYYHRPDSKLEPAGLIGPVKLVAGVDSLIVAQPAGAASVEDLGDHEADVVKDNLLRTQLAKAEDKAAHSGGGKDASALFNGTTRNGDGGTETEDDGKTFRGYGVGDWLTFTLKQPCDLREILSFAGHNDGRASQSYDVLVAYAAAPNKFIKLASGNKAASGGATELRIPVKAERVVAVRFEFKKGPQGFNVYREINLIGENGK
jgi:hypothetical protein